MQNDRIDDDEGSDTDVEDPVRSAEWNFSEVLWEIGGKVRDNECIHQEGAENVQATEGRFRSPLSPVLPTTIQGVIVRVRELVAHVAA